jgi:hypothetical protein
MEIAMHEDRGNALAVALLIVGLGMSAPGLAVGGEVPVAPRGEYAQIDTRLANETIQALTNGSVEERQRTIDQIKAAADKYAPPVFFALGSVLFQDGKKDEGAFWFYAGQLRANFDANRCADTSAREAPTVLVQQYGTPINHYSFQDLQKLQELVARVVEWDRKTPHHYDHRWINLYGMDAIMSGLDLAAPASPSTQLSLPPEQWDEIAEKTRAVYIAGLRVAVQCIQDHGLLDARECIRTHEGQGQSVPKGDATPGQPTPRVLPLLDELAAPGRMPSARQEPTSEHEARAFVDRQPLAAPDPFRNPSQETCAQLQRDGWTPPIDLVTGRPRNAEVTVPGLGVYYCALRRELKPAGSGHAPELEVQPGYGPHGPSIFFTATIWCAADRTATFDALVKQLERMAGSVPEPISSAIRAGRAAQTTAAGLVFEVLPTELDPGACEHVPPGELGPPLMRLDAQVKPAK